MQYARSLEQLLEGILVVTSIEKANCPPGRSSASANTDTSWEGLETSTRQDAGARRWRLVYINGRQEPTVQSRRQEVCDGGQPRSGNVTMQGLACLY